MEMRSILCFPSGPEMRGVCEGCQGVVSSGNSQVFQKVENQRILLIVDPEFMDLEGMGRANRGQERVRDWVRLGTSRRHRVWKRDKGQD